MPFFTHLLDDFKITSPIRRNIVLGCAVASSEDTQKLPMYLDHSRGQTKPIKTISSVSDYENPKTGSLP